MSESIKARQPTIGFIKNKMIVQEKAIVLCPEGKEELLGLLIIICIVSSCWKGRFLEKLGLIIFAHNK
nr:hypothetical protein [uncultured Niameybacter sp.]